MQDLEDDDTEAEDVDFVIVAAIFLPPVNVEELSIAVDEVIQLGR